MSGRRVGWDHALRALRADRAARAEIREERIRPTAGLRGSPAIALSAWRGRSGRRYVVGVHGLEILAESLEGVAIAVRRDVDGIASIVAVAEHWGIADHALDVVALGATEIHVHRLAETWRERHAVVLDLRELAAAQQIGAPVQRNLPPMQHQAPRPVPIVSVG